MSKPDAPLRDLDALLAVFHEAETPRAEWRVGTETERFGVLGPDARPLSYEGPRGVEAIFESLVGQEGWEPERESSDGPIIALRRGSTSVTLEPGAQVELSGSPNRSVAEGQAEWEAHMQELLPITEPLDLTWLGIGCHPFARRDSLGWVPKLRYQVMRHYLPTRGTMALDMMLRTCTVQANLDYESEEDAMRKLRVGLRLQPLVTAMFANSPWLEEADSGFRSYRALAWLHMDPDRSGLLPFAWRDHPTYRDYVEWALDAPMFLVKRNSRVHYNTGQTFRSFMAEGFQGIFPTLADWKTHLGGLFPEVRLKNTLEYRGTDAQGRSLIFALPALWKGLLYDEVALSRAEALVDPWSYEEVEAHRERLARHGVRTRFLRREASDWAGDVLELAEAGLRRLTEQDGNHSDDLHLLQPLRTLLEQALTPADLLLDGFRPNAPFRREVLRLCAL